MKVMDFKMAAWTVLNTALLLAALAAVFLTGIYGIKALRKYLRSGENQREKEGGTKSLGENIREYRSRKNMTQEYVASQLGVSRQAVSKWESGVSDPSTANLLALAKLLEVSPQELAEGTKQ